MSARDPFSDDRPEIVPPVELLRLRARLSRPPAPAVRTQHLTAVATAARQPGVTGQVGRFAHRGARVAVTIVASLAITSGLAAAQVLPPPAQRLLSNVSDRFAPEPEPEAPPASADEPARDSGSPTTDSPSRRDDAATTTVGDGDGSISGGATTTSIASVTPTTTASVVVAAPTTTTTTTILGPAGPGSPTDPTDPDPTDPTTTTTVDPGSTTTTTAPGSTTTTSTTTPGGSTTTTTGRKSP